MFEDRDMKVLLGNSIREPEVDYDDAEVESETGYPVEEEALKEYFYVIVIDQINKSDFRENYLSVLGDIKLYPTKQKQMFAESILNKIKEEYDYQPSRTPDTNTEEEIDNVMKLIQFIEYDHENFIIDVWSYLKPDLNSFQLEKFCEHNQYKIISEIEEQLSSHSFPWMIADFLGTYNKDDIIKWFCEKSENLRTLILLKLM
jgi:hypothetical protein